MRGRSQNCRYDIILKPAKSHDASFVVTVDPESCHNDNLCCHQCWPTRWQTYHWASVHPVKMRKTHPGYLMQHYSKGHNRNISPMYARCCYVLSGHQQLFPQPNEMQPLTLAAIDKNVTYLYIWYRNTIQRQGYMRHGTHFNRTICN